MTPGIYPAGRPRPRQDQLAQLALNLPVQRHRSIAAQA
jgi:hypothetical protein